jgi:hypothetical protein
MNFLRFHLFYIYYIFLHLSLTGSSFLQIGDAISLRLDSSVKYTNTSNVLKSQSNEKSDAFFSLSPGAVVTFGTAGTALDINLRANYDFLEYRKYSDLDTELLKVSLNGSYRPSLVLNTTFNYAYYEGQNAISEYSVNVGGADVLIETVTESASFTTRYNYSPKLSFSLGANLKDLSYDTYANTLSSKKSVSIPFKLYYHYSEKLSIVYGVSITDTKIGERISTTTSGYDTESIYYNVGLRGDILPKLTGSFDIGYRTLSFSTNTKDFNGLGVTSALTWRMTPKLKTLFKVSRDFDAAGSGSTYRATTGNISSIYSINSDYKLSLDYGHTLKFFRSDIVRGTDSRDETLDSFSLKLHYIPSANYAVTAGYRYVESDAQQDYDLNEYELSAQVRY